MGRVTVRSLWAHKRRLLSTVLAIVLGVGFMSGTFILATTIDEAADDLFRGGAAEVDALVQGSVLASGSIAGSQRSGIPVSTVAAVRAVDGVAAAEPRVSTKGSGGTNRILAPAGWPIGTMVGPATILENWITDPELTPYRIDEGRPPEADDEIALDRASVDLSGARVGDTLVVVGQFGPQPYRLVGSFDGGPSSSSGGTVSVELTLAEVQRLAGTRGSIDGVFVKAAGGVGDAELVARLERQLDGVEVVTGDTARAQLAQSSSSDLRFLRVLLQVFGVIALLVGAFVIANTFTILVAQRTRELALLRALGASRIQVFGSVLMEAAVVGVTSSLAGLALGTYLATWINKGIGEIGADVPTSALVVRPDTIVLSLVLGVTATLVAALLPAYRATRVPPLAALRDIAIDRSNVSPLRVAGGVAALGLGAYACSSAWRGDGAGVSVGTTGIGALLIVIGVIVVGPLVAGRTVGVPGRLLQRLRGVTGRLASDNAARNPRRTSATASAVLVSVALVVFVAAFAASAVRSVESDARRGFAGDFIVTGPGGLTLPNGLLSTPIAPSVVAAVRQVPGVDLVVGMGYSSARLTYPDGVTATPFVSSIEQVGLGTVVLPRMDKGRIQDLDDDGIVVDRVVASDHDLELGDTVRYAVADGPITRLRVVGISDDPNLLGHATVTRARFASVAPEVTDVQVGGTILPGADLDEVLFGVRAALSGTPEVWAVDRETFIDDLTDQIGVFTDMIYSLLVLSVFISILGIANTLSLTIHERTHELGLLRALGMDRSGVRATVRWEAVLISLFGMVVGLLVGVIVSVAVITSLRDLGLVTFALPAGSVVMIGVAAVVFGLVASLRPAQRAAGVSILDAIAAE